VAAAGIFAVLLLASAGCAELAAATEAPRPARREALTYRRRRVVATRRPYRETVADEWQGVRLATMREPAWYWANDYDWRGLLTRRWVARPALKR
jgi:hypothetical protein